MPGRKLPLITDQIYHVYNRGIDKRVSFFSAKEFKRAIDSSEYYSHATTPIRFSDYLTSSQQKRSEIASTLISSHKLVDILAYCFMPNHYHFLLKQRTSEGVSKFISKFQNSYTKYFNIRHKRTGNLFQNQFKAVRIEDDEQLLHIHRYIYLNPLTSYLVKNEKGLLQYPWSSLPQYLQNLDLKNTESDLLDFKSSAKFLIFLFNQADYQRKLNSIYHLLIENS